MRKKKYDWTERRVQKFIKQGRGKGAGPDYFPWITVRDFPSKGRVSRIFGLKTQRGHHFFSDLEYRFFIQNEWRDEVVDIREQFPLDRDMTHRIALRHLITPPVTRDGTPFVLTTDFLLDVHSDGNRTEIAHTAKYSSALDDMRTLEKLEIERRYWKEKTVPWSIITEKDIDLTLVKNVEFVRHEYDLTLIQEPFEGCLHKLATLIIDAIPKQPTLPLKELCSALDNSLGIEAGFALTAAKHLLARKIVLTDMVDPTFLAKRPLAHFSLDETQLKVAGGQIGFQ